MCECVIFWELLSHLPLRHERFSLLILEVSWKLKKQDKRNQGHTVCLKLPLVSNFSLAS